MPKNTNPKIISKKHLARLERERIQNRNIMIAAITILVLVLLVVGYGVLDQTYLEARRPVAKVAGTTITSRDFQTQVKYNRYQLIKQYENTAQLISYFGNDPSSASYFQTSLQNISSQLTDSSTFGSNVLDSMINDQLVRQEANKRGITVTKAEVDQALQNDFGYYPNGTPTATLTPTSFSTPTLSSTQLALVTITPTPTTPPSETPTVTPTGPAAAATATTPAITPSVTPTEAATATPTPYTLAGYQNQVKTYVTSIKDLGFTEADLRQVVTAQLYHDKLLADITKGMKPEQDQVWARHILVADEAAAQAVETRLKAGESFAAVAKAVSTDTSTKDNGGDLGWFGPGQMVKEFDTAAFALKVGEISQPVKTTYGYHVIQVLGHEVRQLTDSEFTTVKNQKFQDWLTSAKATAVITKYDLWKTVVPAEPTLSASDLAVLQQTQQQSQPLPQITSEPQGTPTP